MVAAAGGAARALNLGRCKPSKGGPHGRQAAGGDHTGSRSQKAGNTNLRNSQEEGRRTEGQRRASSKGVKLHGEEEETGGQTGAEAFSAPKGQLRTIRTYREEDDVETVECRTACPQGGTMERAVSFTKQPAFGAAHAQMMKGSKAEGCEQSVESDSVPSSPQHARDAFSCHHPAAIAGPLTPGREEHGPCLEPPSPAALTCPSLSLGCPHSAPSGSGALPRSLTSGGATMMMSPGATTALPRGEMTSPGGMKVPQGVGPVPLTAPPPPAVGELEYVPPRSFQARGPNPLGSHLPHVRPTTPIAASAALLAAPSATHHHGPGTHKRQYTPPSSFNPASVPAYCSCSHAGSQKLLGADPEIDRTGTLGCDGSGQCRELCGRQNALQAHKQAGGCTALPPPPLLTPACATPRFTPLPVHASHHVHSDALPRHASQHGSLQSHISLAGGQHEAGAGQPTLRLDKVLAAPAQALSSLAGAAMKSLKGKGSRAALGEGEGGEDGVQVEEEEVAGAPAAVETGAGLQDRGGKGRGQMDESQRSHGQHTAGPPLAIRHALVRHSKHGNEWKKSTKDT